MKTEDFERLKAVCEKEGFVVSTGGVIPGSSILVEVYKKDYWEGVDFLSVVGFDKIYKIKRFSNDVIIVTKSACKPSTEQAYIEQLKKEAFERFGEIKEGDRFDRTTIDEKWGYNTIMDKSPFGNFHWKYDRSSDTLFIGRFGIYSKGRWATRVKERVEVELIHETLSNNPTYQFKLTNWNETNRAKYSGQFLASQLEKYLNGEVE